MIRIPDVNHTNMRIIQAYQAYQTFIGLKLPPIKIKHYNQTDDCSEGSANIRYNSDTDIILTVDRLLPLTYKYGFRDVLFHEFTHIYDHYTFNKCKDMKPSTFSAFTEIHASYIKLMSAFGFQSYEGEKELCYDSELRIFRENRTLLKFILMYFQELIDYIAEYKLDKSTNKFAKMFNHLLYCIGYLQFCERYCKMNTLTISCFSKLEETLGADILQLYNVICYPYDHRSTDFTEVSRIIDDFLFTTV